MDQGSPHSPQTRVLVVDDHPGSAELVCELLQLQGFETRQALDGTEALTVARELLPHFVILDLGLPDIDGMDVALLLRGEPSLQGVVVIALTGHSDQRWRQQAMDAGCDHYLVKPFSQQQMLSILRGRA